MPLWNRWKTPRNQVLDVSVEIDIFASPSEVWELIRPAENAVLIDPATVRAFHVPGTPLGVGEMQGFITRQDGREHIGMIEVLEEVSDRYALTRPVGSEDDAHRVSYILHEAATGTRFELRTTFTVPAELWEQTDAVVEDLRHRSYEFVRRVKTVTEDRIHQK